MDNQVVTNLAQAYPVYGWLDLQWDSALNPLNINRSGNGRVKGPGVDCGSTCLVSVARGKNVTLTAEAEPGWVFSTWGGDCPHATGTCSVTLDEPRSVDALFTQVNAATATHSLTVRLTESTLPGCHGDNSNGTVTTNPSLLVCNINVGSRAPLQCSVDVEHGTSVALSASTGEQTNFVGFTGNCTGSSCNIIVNEDRKVEASFCSLFF
jgi:hypothetical protein